MGSNFIKKYCEDITTSRTYIPVHYCFVLFTSVKTSQVEGKRYGHKQKV